MLSQPSLTSTPISLGGAFADAVASGLNSTCVLDTGGRVLCFGDGAAGELGLPGAAPTAVPTELLVGQVALTYGEPAQGYASIQSDGSIEYWGTQIACFEDGGTACNPVGSPTVNAPPVDAFLPLGDTAAMVATSQTHLCALGYSGAVYCLGKNISGELGDGTTNNSAAFVQALVPEAAVDLSVGFTHSCARGKSGTIYCWGSNSDGQLGVDPVMVPASAMPVAAR